LNRLLFVMLVLVQACASRVIVPPPLNSRHAPEPLPLVSDALSERMQSLTAALLQQGFRRGDTQVSGFLPNGDRHAEKLRLPARSCVAFVAVASAAMNDLDASFYTRDGTALIEDDNTDARPVLLLCTGEEARDVYYTLHAYQGGGAFLVQSFVRPQRAEDRSVAFDVGPTRGNWGPLANRLKTRGFDEQGAPVSLELAEKAALRVAVSAEVGHCYAFVADVDPALLAPTLSVVDLGGRELARGAADGGPLALQFCASNTQDLALIVSSEGGRGSLLLSRFVAREEKVGGRRALWLGEPTR